MKKTNGFFWVTISQLAFCRAFSLLRCNQIQGILVRSREEGYEIASTMMKVLRIDFGYELYGREG